MKTRYWALISLITIICIIGLSCGKDDPVSSSDSEQNSYRVYLGDGQSTFKVFQMPGDSLVQTIVLNYTYADYRITPDGAYLLLRRYNPPSIAVISTDSFDEVASIAVSGDMFIANDENALLVDSYQKIYKVDLSSFAIIDSATTNFYLGECDTINHITYGAGNDYGTNDSYTYLFDYQNMTVADSMMMVTPIGFAVSPNRTVPIPSKNRLYVEAMENGLIYDTQLHEFVGSFPCNAGSSIIVAPGEDFVYVAEPVEFNHSYIPIYKTTIVNISTDQVAGYFSTITNDGDKLAISKMMITPGGDYLIGVHPTTPIKINTITGEVTRLD